MTATNGLDQPKADLASVIFEAWRRLGPNATPQNASGELARAVLDAMGAWSMTEDPRIREIRAVLDEVDQSGACEGDGAYLGSQLDRIREILDSAPPAPRVFFPGDTVPAGIWVLSGRLGFHRVPWDWTITETYVEAHPMTREQWQAAVDRATSARAIPEPTEGQNP